MTTAANINELLRQMPFDCRLEVLLAALLKDDLSIDNVVVMNDSLFKRNYHRDIEDVREIEFEQSRKKKLLFLVNRDGIYDQVPQDLFHQPPELGMTPGKEAVLTEIRNQQNVEKDTRRFFLPIEQEMYRQRIMLALEEQEFAGVSTIDQEDNIFTDLWDLPDLFDNTQKNKLGLLMPLLHKITGNKALIPFILEHITGYKVSLETTAPIKYASPEWASANPASSYFSSAHQSSSPFVSAYQASSHQSSSPFASAYTASLAPHSAELGSTRLGVDSILGGIIPELQPSLTLHVLLHRGDSVLECMTGGAKSSMFEFLGQILFPYETTLTIEWTLPDKDQFVLGDSESPNTARLDYTTII